MSGDVEFVHEVCTRPRGTFDVVYAEDNPLWILAGPPHRGRAARDRRRPRRLSSYAGLWAAHRVEALGRGALMLVYHRTAYGKTIQCDGFLDGEGTYLTSEVWRGVWVSADSPLGENEGAHGDDVLALEIPDALFVKYEWVEDLKGYREVLDSSGRPERLPAVPPPTHRGRARRAMVDLSLSRRRRAPGGATRPPDTAGLDLSRVDTGVSGWRNGCGQIELAGVGGVIEALRDRGWDDC